MTLSWKNAEGESIVLGDFKPDGYGIADKSVKVLLEFQGQPGVKFEDGEGLSDSEDEDFEDDPDAKYQDEY